MPRALLRPSGNGVEKPDDFRTRPVSGYADDAADNAADNATRALPTIPLWFWEFGV